MKKQIITVPVTIRTRGRVRAVVHTGHEYDEFGNVTKFGEVLRETPFNNNKITLTGFNNILLNTSTNLHMVCGSGNTAPTEADTTLVSYLGKTATFASSSTTRNTTPDVNGDVTWTCTKRMTFGPSSMGGGTVNVAEAGIVCNVSLGSITGATPVSARGLLVDGGGAPTTVSVNNAIEYLDIIWEYTEYIPSSVTGTVNLTIDGAVISHDYEVRPYHFDNIGGSFNYGPWRDVTGNAWLAYGPIVDSTYTWSYAANNFTSAPVAITGVPLGTGVRADIPIQTVAAYVSNSKQRSINLTWLPVTGNKNTTLVRLNLTHTGWQIWFDPLIAKVSTKQLDLAFVLTYANK